MSSSGNQSRLSLEEIAFLNDEICALVRAGLPLPLGLKSAAGGLRKQVAGVVDSLADHIASGHSLDEAIDLQRDAFPPVYRALVTAGLKTGRLDQALASLSSFSRSLEQLRQKIGLALFYPTLLLLIAWGLWTTFLVTLFPKYDSVLLDFGAGHGPMQSAMRTVATTVPLWFPLLPLAVLVAGASWWMSQKWLLQSQSEGVPWHPGRISAALIRRLPWIGPILMNFHRANFTELLALMLKHDVPLSVAVPLAIDGSGDPKLSANRAEIISGIQNGVPLGEVLDKSEAMTPFLHWMIQAAEARSPLHATMAQATTILRRRAMFQVEWFQLAFPVLILAIVGGGTVLIYCLSLFLPVIDLLDSLSQV
tara:strand:+ start:273 stop:1367 length:1095 start_codon:yes stop_codon:yes gene_type:complete